MGMGSLTPLNCTFEGTEVRPNFWQNLSRVSNPTQACRHPVSSTAWSSGTCPRLAGKTSV
eukprot:7810476-Heterocapsa_arctica.AAC.1